MSWAVSCAPAVSLYNLLSIVPALPAILSICDILCFCGCVRFNVKRKEKQLNWRILYILCQLQYMSYSMEETHLTSTYQVIIEMLLH